MVVVVEAEVAVEAVDEQLFVELLLLLMPFVGGLLQCWQ